MVDLGRAALADVIVLAIPLSKYEMVLKPLSKLICKQSLLVDICSVKMEPERLINKHLPDHPNLLLTHPLFGPRSVVDGLAGHRLAVTHASGRRASMVLRHCRELGLDVKRVSAQEHDRAMQIHALTLFVAKALENMNLGNNSEFSTPSSMMLLNLAEFSQTSSPDLIDTIQKGNLFAKKIRYKFINHLKEIDNEWAQNCG